MNWRNEDYHERFRRYEYIFGFKFEQIRIIIYLEFSASKVTWFLVIFDLVFDERDSTKKIWIQFL